MTSSAERFWLKVERRSDDECWPWLASQLRGYGSVSVDGCTRQAHRVAYELFVGPIPDGLEIDHLCRNRGCCNPAHLEPVTHAENMRRARRSHCAQGHPFSNENTYTVHKKSGTRRRCRECHRLTERARKDRRAQERVSV